MMKTIKELLLPDTEYHCKGNIDLPVSGLSFDSRTVEPGHCFIALKGTRTDGHQYIDTAITKGATCIVCEEYPNILKPDITYIRVDSTSTVLGHLASRFYNNPSSRLTLIGVTGTNGKTTTATLLFRIIRKMGYKAGLISTVSYYVNDKLYPATHTTPDPLQLNRLLHLMVAEGCRFCFMEVSSHAIVQNRISGLQFAGGLFTNITHDHLDYHKTFRSYIEAKKLFFDRLSSQAFALTNTDSKQGNVMLQNCRAKRYSYALKTPADFKGRVMESHLDGMLLIIDGQEVWTRLIGRFNAYNLLAVYATLRLLNLDKTEILTRISEVPAVRGRFEYVKSEKGPVAIVDYAHTPDALANVIDTITEIAKAEQRIITVVGAGGDRDKTKRPIMAKVAVEKSHLVILTSDNPRSEDPEAIISDMQKGVPADQSRKVLAITNRKEAIRTACTIANPNDIILVAGKGHETYQEINGIRHHFDDREILEETFKSLQL